MNRWLLSKVLSFVKGLFFTYLAMIVFFALGWLRTAVDWPEKSFLMPFYVALIAWTALYLVVEFIFFFGSIFVAFTMGFGIFFVFGIIGCGTLVLARYLLPHGWLMYQDDWLVYSVIGLVYAAIGQASHVHVPKKDKKEKQAQT